MTRRQWRDSKYGKGYDAFRTGLDFDSAQKMLRVGGDDPSRWKYIRRGTVLGFLHELKLQLWHGEQPGFDRQGFEREFKQVKCER